MNVKNIIDITNGGINSLKIYLFIIEFVFIPKIMSTPKKLYTFILDPPVPRSHTAYCTIYNILP